MIAFTWAAFVAGGPGVYVNSSGCNAETGSPARVLYGVVAEADAAEGENEPRYAQLFDMPLSQIESIIRDSGYRSVTSGKAMATLSKSRGAKPREMAIAVDRNENLDHFLTSGCENYRETVKRILGDDVAAYVSADPGLTDPKFDEAEEGWVDWYWRRTYNITCWSWPR